MRRLLTVLVLTSLLLALSACGSIVEPAPANPCIVVDTLGVTQEGATLIKTTYYSPPHC